MRMEPSVFATLKVAFAPTSYFCSTLSSSGSMANKVRKKNSAIVAAIAMARKAGRLLIPQRYHGIDLHGAAGGNVTGERRGHDEQTDDPGIGDNISGADSVEHRAEQSGETDRGEHSHEDAGEHQGEALAENHSQHVETLG